MHIVTVQAVMYQKDYIIITTITIIIYYRNINTPA